MGLRDLRLACFLAGRVRSSIDCFRPGKMLERDQPESFGLYIPNASPAMYLVDVFNHTRNAQGILDPKHNGE